MEKNNEIGLFQILSGDAGWQKMSPKQFLIAVWFTLSLAIAPVVAANAIETDSYLLAIVAVINFYYSCKCVKNSKIKVEE